MRWQCLGEDVSVEKRKSKEQFRDITLNVSFFYVILFSHDFWMSFRFQGTVFRVNNSKKNKTLHRQCGLCISFINLGKPTVLTVYTLTKIQWNSCLPCPDLSSYFYMMGSKPAFFLLYLKGIPLKFLVKRKR